LILLERSNEKVGYLEDYEKETCRDLRRRTSGSSVRSGATAGTCRPSAKAYLTIRRKRIPGYTDRILFASHTDPPHLSSPQATLTPTPPPVPESTTQIRHFSSTPDVTISDHKPVNLILTLPDVTHSAPAPHLAPVLHSPPPPHPKLPSPTPKEQLLLYKLLGTILDRLVGWPWCLIVLLGGGNAQTGMGVSAFVAMLWGAWWSGVWSG